ncbi:MAG: uroporphyrinogen-III synthase [Gemmataceae bacterium]|nr:uroporphyrinogen-III synthase [Gemmataceae bacterium]
MTRPLEGCRVALAEGRQLEDLADMLVKEGATPLRYPMVSILDAPDAAPVIAWLRELVADRFSHVVLLTGEGLRRLLGFAQREGTHDDVIAAIRRTRTVTRGPKPVQALRAVGLTPTVVAAIPTTEGVIAVLREESLTGRTVGVQLYSPANPPLAEFIEKAGATVRTVLPYVYAPAADSERIADLIQGLTSKDVDVLVFTSSPQVDRLYEVAAERKLDTVLNDGLKHVKVAAVGPVVADHLRHHGVRVDICPEQGFVMKNLVQQIKRAVHGGA